MIGFIFKKLRMSLALAIFFICCSVVTAGEKESDKNVKRVGGIYKVSLIKKLAQDDYKIEFSSVSKTGRYDKLFLESDHVHVGIDEGVELRLSAEVIEDKGDVAEVGQVLLFFPSGDTYVPVWLLSKKFSNLQLRGSKYLEMHVPTSDYLIF